MNSLLNGDTVKNDSPKPLEDKTISITEDGITKEIPALHKTWVAKRYYLPYCPPPRKQNGSFELGAKENWLEHVRIFCQDMKWLLQLKQHQFWSQVMYDTSTMAAIVSFLQESLPYYALSDFPNDDEMWKAYQETYRHVILVISRLSTNKESKTSYMTPKFYGDLIYDHYIFTVPVLFDLCVLCGHNNHGILVRIFSTVFKAQPRYLEDLKKSVACILQVLQGISHCVGLKMPLDTEPERITLRDGNLSSNVLSDIILHILDTAYTLSNLTETFTPSCEIFHQNNFEVNIVWFYENVIPELYNKLETLIMDEEPSLFISLKNKLDNTRLELLKTFRNTLFYYINSAMDSSDPAVLRDSVDDYVNVLTECLAEKLFMRDYHLMYNVGQDLDLLAQLSPDMDADKRSYILHAVIDSLDGPELPISPSSSPNLPPFSSTKREATQTASSSPQPSGSQVPDSFSKLKITGVKLDSLISQVKDILPHLGDGFIEQCLEYYKFVTEDVIHAILESKLPPSLQELDPELPRIPAEVNETVPTVEINIMSDDDEEPQYATAHKGKRKDMYRDVMMMLNDKSHLDDYRDFYAPLSLYEDEYDDTYDDTLDVTVGDDDDPERNNAVANDRPTVTSSTEGEDSDEGTSSNNFVENPEKIRAQQEQRRLAKGGAPRRDLVGKPKGQGQDKNVIINRNQKTAHKSQRANHNRRAGAQRKRQQGMFPS